MIEILWILWILLGPLVVGFVFGLFVRSYRLPYWWLLCTVPFVSTFLVALVLFLFQIYDLLAHPQFRNAHPLYLQAMGGAGLFAGAILVYGFLPSLFGYLTLCRDGRYD